jgi:hypothetical protein
MANDVHDMAIVGKIVTPSILTAAGSDTVSIVNSHAEANN